MAAGQYLNLQKSFIIIKNFILIVQLNETSKCFPSALLKPVLLLSGNRFFYPLVLRFFFYALRPTPTARKQKGKQESPSDGK